MRSEKHDAPAEGVVGPVPLDHGDPVRRVRFFIRIAKKSPGRSAAEHVDLHAGPVTTRTSASPVRPAAASPHSSRTAAATASGSTSLPDALKPASAATASANGSPVFAAIRRALFQTMSVATKPGQIGVDGDAAALGLGGERRA